MFLRLHWARHASLGAPFLLAGALLGSGVARAQVGTVRAQQKISELAGSLGFVLDPEDHFGDSLASLGDLNGDGVGDLAVGAPGDDDGGSGQGAVYILFLRPDGRIASKQKISETSGGFGGHLSFGDAFGLSVASLGDLNGDGIGDLAVGSEPGSFQGALWILFMNSNGTVADERKIAEGLAGFGGSLEPDDRFSESLAGLGDLNGDGVVDLAVGAPRDDDVLPNRGSVWILFLNPDGTVAGEQKISASEGGFIGPLNGNAEFGHALAGLGDFDGDGVRDLAVGTFDYDDGSGLYGAVWLLFLSRDGTVRSQRKISHTEGGFSSSGALFFGSSLAALDDLDGNGVRDLAVGSYGDDEAWILFLNGDGTVASQQGIAEGLGGFTGEVTDDFFGLSMAWLPHFGGDRAGVLSVGVPWDDDGGIDQGALWNLFLEAHLRLDFSTQDDFETLLVNGQDLSTPPEFGRLVALSSSGPNARAAIFDSTPGGPNDPSQDRDLLVGSGNVLILQTNDNTTQTVPGRFDRPNDDEDGGILSFAFTAPVKPCSLALVDIDSGSDETSQVALTDEAGKMRIFTVPPGWTGDLLVDGVGRRTLDLLSLAPQPGFASTATVFEDRGYAPERVVGLELQLGSSGALDDLVWLPGQSHADGHPSARGSLPVGASTLREIQRP